MPEPENKSRAPREPWIIRTYAGFGDARQANERFLANLKQGQRGLSIAFDLPTQNGYDPDAPVARGEVGEAGVSICHWDDMERLFEGIPLQSINTSMTINATAPFLLALYLVVAEKHGVPWTELRGTTQNDLLKEFVARGTSIFHPELSFRLSTELIRFAVERVPNWNPINCCGYHYMESGAGPAEEIGYAFGNALLILDAIRAEARRGGVRADGQAHFIFHQQRNRAGARDLQDSRVLQTVARAVRERIRHQGRRLSARDARCDRSRSPSRSQK